MEKFLVYKPCYFRQSILEAVGFKQNLAIVTLYFCQRIIKDPFLCSIASLEDSISSLATLVFINMRFKLPNFSYLGLGK